VLNIAQQTNLADELNVVALNVADDHDLHLGQEVKRKVRNSLAAHGHKCSLSKEKKDKRKK
jgi:hypothetical protein